MIYPEDAMAERLQPLRERILAGDNTHCFIERQEILAAVEPEAASLPEEERYAFVFERLLDGLSPSIGPDDVIVGRMMEGMWNRDAEMRRSSPFCQSSGHTTLDWPVLLSKGLDCVASEAQTAADRNATDEARRFARNVSRCCQAVGRFCARHATASRRMAAASSEPPRSHLFQVADCLEHAPSGPSTDFFMAVQAMWMIQLITSCVVGARDFSYGRIDQYLLPLYRRGVADGTLTPDLARTILAHLFIKTKEITGTATDNYQVKPIPSFASNQYVTIGGRSPDGAVDVNELSYLVLEAACLAYVPQPGINVRIDPDYPLAFKQAVAAAMASCAPQINLWNDRSILATLERFYPAVERDDRFDYAFTACNRVNFPGREVITHGERWHCMPSWLLLALNEGRGWQADAPRLEGIPPLSTIASVEELLAHFATVARVKVNEAVGGRQPLRQSSPPFSFESILLRDCVARSKDARDGGIRYQTQFHLFSGVATVADSLAAIRRLVFGERRYSLGGIHQDCRE